VVQKAKVVKNLSGNYIKTKITDDIIGRICSHAKKIFTIAAGITWFRVWR
jgi:glycerol-3-phosphate dehydrogenase (NAD(P)+)